MSKSERSLEKISIKDLQQLADVARLDRKEFFDRFPKYQVLEDRIIAVALCQGAALHYIDSINGIKDFDVWTFFGKYPNVQFPFRRYIARDFGNPKFGQSPDTSQYIGRRVDLLGRSLDVDVGSNPIETLQKYLRERKTSTATELAKKAVILIEPVELLGSVAWQPLSNSKRS